MNKIIRLQDGTFWNGPQPGKRWVVDERLEGLPLPFPEGQHGKPVGRWERHEQHSGDKHRWVLKLELTPAEIEEVQLYSEGMAELDQYLLESNEQGANQ